MKGREIRSNDGTTIWSMNSSDPSNRLRLRLKLEGEDVLPGKIPFRDLKKLAELTQTGLERTARALLSTTRPSAELKHEITEATELLLIGIEEGSAVAVAELREPQPDTSTQEVFPDMPPRDFGTYALAVLVDGLHELEVAASPVIPDKWDNSVMEIAEELVGFTKDRGVVLSLSMDTPDRPRVATVRGEEAEKFQIRHAIEKKRRSVRGELVLIDIDTARIDVKSLSGKRTHCTFHAEVKDQILSLIGHQVIATGQVEIDVATGRTSPLVLSSVADAGDQMSLSDEFWRNPSAEERARQQQVQPLERVGTFSSPLFDDDEVDAFLAEIDRNRP